MPLTTCPWLVEVANGNPEPDSPSDCYDIVECGAPVEMTHGGEGWRCSNGHEHIPIAISWAPFGPEWQREQEQAHQHGGT